MIVTTTTLCSVPTYAVTGWWGDEVIELCTHHVDESPCPEHGTTLEDVR